MTTRGIIEIDLEGHDKFRDFLKHFGKFKKDLGDAPASWAEMSRFAQKVEGEFRSIADYAQEQLDAKRGSNKKDEESHGTAKAVSIVWGAIAGYTENAFEHIKKSTGHLTKWSTLTAALSGLLGAGGLWGLDRLAHAINNQRRFAMGTSAGYGLAKSATTNLSPILNAGGLLSNLTEAKYNANSEQFLALSTLGVSQQKIKYGKTEDVIDDVFDRLPKLFGSDKSLWGTYAKSYHTSALMSNEELFRLLNMSPEERAERQRQMHADAKKMDMSDRATKAWADLVVQLNRAVGTIESAFMEKMAALAPALIKLSENITNIVVALINSDQAKEWINLLSGGLESLAGYVKSPDFQSGVENFVTWIMQAAKAIWDFIAGFAETVSPAIASGLNTAAGISDTGGGGEGSGGASTSGGGGGSGKDGKDGSSGAGGGASVKHIDLTPFGPGGGKKDTVSSLDTSTHGGLLGPAGANFPTTGAPSLGGGADPRQGADPNRQDAFGVWSKASKGSGGGLMSTSNISVQNNTPNNTVRTVNMVHNYTMAPIPIGQ